MLNQYAVAVTHLTLNFDTNEDVERKVFDYWTESIKKFNEDGEFNIEIFDLILNRMDLLAFLNINAIQNIIKQLRNNKEYTLASIENAIAICGDSYKLFSYVQILKDIDSSYFDKFQDLFLEQPGCYYKKFNFGMKFNQSDKVRILKELYKDPQKIYCERFIYSCPELSKYKTLL